MGTVIQESSDIISIYFFITAVVPKLCFEHYFQVFLQATESLDILAHTTAYTSKTHLYFTLKNSLSLV